MAQRAGGRQKSNQTPKPEPEADRAAGEVQGEALEPIKTIKRTLTRPDGSVVEVEVPVYPPFRLADASTARKPPARKRSTPSLKRKR